MKNNIINKTLSILMIICFLGFPQISETIYSPALPSMVKDLHASTFLVELTLSIYFIGFAVGVGLWGRVSDIWGRRPTMLVGLVVYTVSCLLLATASNITTVLILRGVQALGASVGSIVTQTMLRDTLTGNRRSKVFSIVSVALAFSPAIGPVIGSILAMNFEWQANFWFLMGMGGILFAYAVMKLPETLSEENVQASRSISMLQVSREMLFDKKIWMHTILISICNGIIFSFFSEGPFLFMDVMGFSAMEYGMLGMLISAGTLIAATLSYYLNNYWKSEQIIRLGVQLSIVGSGILAILAMAGVLSMNVSLLGFIGIVTALTLVFLGVGLIIPNSLSTCLADYKNVVGTAGAVFGVAYYIGVALLIGAVSLLHNGTALTLPLFFFAQALVLRLGLVLEDQDVELSLNSDLCDIQSENV